MKFKDLGYRANHSFMIADRIEDLTQPDLIRQNPKSDRTLCFYGYVRGCALKKSADIHIPGIAKKSLKNSIFFYVFFFCDSIKDQATIQLMISVFCQIHVLCQQQKKNEHLMIEIDWFMLPFLVLEASLMIKTPFI